MNRKERLEAAATILRDAVEEAQRSTIASPSDAEGNVADGMTRTRFEVPFVCSNRHDPVEVAVRVQTLITLSSGKEAVASNSRDVPPGRPVPPLPSVPLDRQRAKYEMKCPSCTKRYEVRPEKAERAIAAALESGATAVDLKSVAG